MQQNPHDAHRVVAEYLVVTLNRSGTRPKPGIYRVNGNCLYLTTSRSRLFAALDTRARQLNVARAQRAWLAVSDGLHAANSSDVLAASNLSARKAG